MSITYKNLGVKPVPTTYPLSGLSVSLLICEEQSNKNYSVWQDGCKDKKLNPYNSCRSAGI